MKYGLMIPLSAILLGACSGESDDATAKRTILVYMAAENSLSSFALDDVEEMIVGMKSIDDSKNNLLVYLDANTRDATTQSKSAPAIYRIRKNKSGNVVKEIVYQYPEQDDSSVTVARMTDVFQRSFGAFEADSYGLVLWSHGDGWIPYQTSSLRSFGQDGGSNGPMMDILDLEEAISVGTNSLKGSGKFDFVFFDACFMQSVEVLYQLRSYCNFIIGCPMETPAQGSPYDKILPYLFSEGEAGVKGLAEYYYESYEANYNGGKNSSNENWTSGVCISAVRTEGLEQLADATKALYSKYSSRLNEVTEAGVASVQYFDHNRRYNRVQMRVYNDFGDYINYLSSDDDYAAWKSVLDNAIVYAESTPTCYCSSAYIYTGNGDIAINAYSGLSSYIMFASDSKYSAYNSYYTSLDWYKQVYR